MAAESLVLVFLGIAGIGIIASFVFGFPSPFWVIAAAGGYVLTFVLIMGLDVSPTETSRILGVMLPTGMILDFSIGYFVGLFAGLVAGLAGG